jgi:lysophospholipase L1-like esterase
MTKLFFTSALAALAAALGLAPAEAEARAPASSSEYPAGARQRLSTPIRYAAIGASDTVGVGARSPGKQGWTARFGETLPGGTVSKRFARSGITLAEAARQEIPEAIAFRPTLVTLWLVVNDALHGVPLPQYEAQLRDALDRLTRETDAQIVLLNAPDLSRLPRLRGSPELSTQVREMARAWNEAIDEVASGYGDRVLVVDLFGASGDLGVHLDWMSSDGFHPSASGYQRIAEVTSAAIHRAGLLPPGR